MKRPISVIGIALIVVVGFAWLSPATGQDRTEERLSELEARVELLEFRVNELEGTASVAADEQYEIVGSVTILGKDNRLYSYATETCRGAEGFEDIQAGVKVVVRDGDGNIIGTSVLQDGLDPQVTLTSCEFPFRVSALPESGFYEISIGQRIGPIYSLDELSGKAWLVELTLGE